MLKKDRLIETLRCFAEIGDDGGNGITRLGFSDELFKAAEKMVILSKSMKYCETFFDRTGSLHIVLPSDTGCEDEIVFGSHYDTVPNGGLYDGAAGIAAGMEVLMHIIEEKEKFNHKLHLIAFNAEEAGPLGGTYSSRSMLCEIPYDEESVKIFEEKRQQSEILGETDYKEWNPEKTKAFLEMHIEQGGILDSEKLDIGVVTGIFGIRRYEIICKGESNHAGTTPMNQRKDPMVAAAGIIAYINNRAKEYGDKLVATVGKVDVKPNLESIIPDSVEMVMEMRSLDNQAMDCLYADVCKYAAKIEYVEVESRLKVEKPPLLIDDEICNLESAACENEKLKYKRMPSGAGHDAKSFAKAGIPTGMIFVPSINGKSHTPVEYTTDEQLYLGTKVLYDTIRLLDEK